MALRIAIITDIHHGKDAEAKKGASALRLIAEFAEFVAAEKPDLVLELGDRISDEDPVTDPVLEREVHAALDAVRAIAPIHHVCGNHDRDFMSVAENEAILGQKLGNEIVACGDWDLVLFRADTLIRRPGGFDCPEADIAWLEAAMKNAERPTLIASHVPVSGHSQIGNYYFENNPGHSTYPQAARLRAALRAAKGPVAWISGHVHWNTLTTVDGVVHMTQQSLTESFVTGPETGKGVACGAYGLLTLDADNLDWQVFGLDRFRATVPLRQLARRWYPVLPNFAEIPGHRERAARIAAFQSAQPAMDAAE